MALEITAARPDPALLDLPWRLPLEEWPDDILAALPRGISRHVVRFVRLSGRVLAVKEIKADIARREYEMLRNLNRLRMPCVEPFAVVSGRIDADGMPLDACLITRHLQFSLPYRALYSQSLRKGTATRLIDALAVLLVRLHLAGLLVGRRVAVEHAVPARRRRVRRLPRRRRDRRAARAAQQRAARARPRDRPGQHRRRADGPRGRRPAPGGPRPRRDQRAHRHPLPRAVGRAHRLRAHRRLRAVARRRPHPPAQRHGLRRRRARDHDRHRRHVDPHPAQGRRLRAPLAPPAAAHRARRAREPGPTAAQRPRRLHAPRPAARARTRRSSRTTGSSGCTSR